jgi:hypothetical protein
VAAKVTSVVELPISQARGRSHYLRLRQKQSIELVGDLIFGLKGLSLSCMS